MLWLLLKNKFRTIYNGYVKESDTRGRRKILALFAAGLVFYAVYNWAHELFRVIMISQKGDVTFMLNLLIIFLFGFFIFLFFSGITVSIHYLFVSGDLPLLLSSPLSGKIIFSYKLIESVFANSSFFLFVGIPIFIAFGEVAQNMNLSYILGMMFTVLAFITLPVSISFIISLFIVRVLPASRAKELMAVLLGLISLGLWFFIQIFRTEEFNRFSADYNADKISQLSLFSGNYLIEYLPSSLAAKSIFAFAMNDYQQLIAGFIPLVIITSIVIIAALLLAQKVFDAGIISPYSESGKIRKTRSRSGTALLKRYDEIFRTTMISVFLRDIKLLFRDFRHLTSTMILVIMMIIFPLIRAGDDTYLADEAFLLFIPIVFFSGIISGQLSSRLIPLEGKSFWITMMAPQRWSRIIGGKFILAVVLNLGAIWIAVLVSSVYFHITFRVVAVVLALTFLITVSCSMYGLMIGSLFPNFNWEHPKRMLTSGGTLLLSIGSLAGVAVWVGGLSLIYTVFLGSSVWADMTAIMISSLITAFVLFIGTQLISRKMVYLEWNFS